MITVVGMWEPGFSDEQMFMEWRMWKQTIEAFAVDRWLMVGQGPSKCGRFEPYESMNEALALTRGKRIFLIPNWGCSLPRDYPPEVVYIFGNTSENLKRYIREEDSVASIDTPVSADLFAACCLPLVLAA